LACDVRVCYVAWIAGLGGGAVGYDVNVEIDGDEWVGSFHMVWRREDPAVEGGWGPEIVGWVGLSGAEV
jgi:hypothetical protein